MAKAKRVAPGVYRDAYGLDARVAIGTWPHRLQSAKRYPRTESLRVIKAWQTEERDRLQKLQPSASRGPFDGDIQRYLLTLADRPRLQAERRHQLRWWADQTGADGKRFGLRRRHTFQRAELHATLVARAILPSRHHPDQRMSASSVKHYRTALFHLFTTLDGKNAPNPLRDVPTPESPDPEPRALPYAIIEAIFDAMPDSRRATKVDADQVATIVALASRPGAHKTTIARMFGVTEAAIRKMLRTGGRRAPELLTKLRLRVMAYVGLPPAQIMGLREEHVHWDEPSVLVQGRRKGKGSRTVRLPLTPQGVDTLRAFFAGGAAGRFDTTAARRTWWRGIRTMVDRLALTDYVAARELLRSLQRVRARPYDLRHSFLTEAQLAGKNIHATQQLAMHADSRQTQRYTLAAVQPQLLELAAIMGQRLPPSPSKR